jgi:tetratricopeptide (TPR) repeat protein
MWTTRREPGGRFLALALLFFVGALPLRAAEDDALRKEAVTLNELTGQDPISGRILELLEDEAGTKKLLAVAAKMAKEKEQPFNINATYILATLASADKEIETAQFFYRLNAEQALKLQSEEKLSRAYAGLIQMYFDNKKYADSEKVCREFLELETLNTEPDPLHPERASPIERLKPIVMRHMIRSIARQGNLDKAVDLIDKLMKADPNNWLNLQLKGQILRDAGSLEEAAKIYEDVIERIKKDKRLTNEQKVEWASDLRYPLSGIYVDLNQVDKAAEQLKTLLAKEPNNPTYNNDLGYIWADHDINLEESEKLIRKALEEDKKLRAKGTKDNPAYLDSLGWVLYKQKKYKEALPPLLEAVQDKDGKHIEIYDHLGDVHLALGEKAEAVAAWKEGLKVVGDSKREQARKIEVEKKLKAHE